MPYFPWLLFILSLCHGLNNYDTPWCSFLHISYSWICSHCGLWVDCISGKILVIRSLNIFLSLFFSILFQGLSFLFHNSFMLWALWVFSQSLCFISESFYCCYLQVHFCKIESINSIQYIFPSYLLWFLSLEVLLLMLSSTFLNIWIIFYNYFNICVYKVYHLCHS